MYPAVRDLLVHSLGHSPERVDVDTSQPGTRDVPDLVLWSDTGLLDARDRPIRVDWAVFEVKSERGAFRNPQSREAIFDEKAKYAKVGTEWFVMIDPEVLVARPAATASRLEFDPGRDIVVEWDGLTEDRLRDSLRLLLADNAGASESLRLFREGDESRIAVVKLRWDDDGEKLTAAQKARLKRAPQDFLDTIRACTSMLQNSSRRLLESLGPEIAEIDRRLDRFAESWGGMRLALSPLRLRGKKIDGAEAKKRHDAEVKQMREDWRRKRHLLKLARRGLPAFRERAGKKARSEQFAIETANLILARILMMRFLEDHDFFGGRKYVCNGGVAALQSAMEYHGKGYTLPLRFAYEKGGEIYPRAFDETDLDWVFGEEDFGLSRAIELTMMYLSRFDFSTVSGDILNGVYDRFLTADQRKRMGEYYTPPSVARHIIDRLGVKPGDSVLDPACGSGTFLLEAFERVVGEKMRRGAATFEEVCAALANISGNDLNPFSATVAQIQMLWHLMPMKERLKRDGFPAVRISERHNALLAPALTDGADSMFAELDAPEYDFVVGNPPYVRPERQTDDMGKDEAAYYKEIGGTRKNLYDLFIYKTLRGWCRPANGGRPGRMGFVAPLSFCSNESGAKLREMFRPGGEFRLLEIVDMESIAPRVFDATVNPVVILAERRPAREDDKVIIRVAGQSCVKDAALRTFDLARAAGESFPMRSIFTDDGFILTKLTARRGKILDKIGAHSRFADIVRPYWVGLRKNKIEKALAAPPPDINGNNLTPDGLRWEKREMAATGASYRGKKRAASKNEKGLDFYKGENIRACRVENLPADENIVPSSVDDPSLWRFPDILPERGFVLPRICRGVAAAPLNPREMACLSTTTVFFPREELAKFPFDILLLSRVYQFHYAVALRPAPIAAFWGAMYAGTLRSLPWTKKLRGLSARLEKKRKPFLRACENLHNRGKALSRALENAGCSALRTACGKTVAMDWPSALAGGDKVAVDAPLPATVKKSGGGFVVNLNSDERVVFSDADVARRFAAALTIHDGAEMSHEDFLKMGIPNEKSVRAFADAVRRHDRQGAQNELARVINEIDEMVGDAFGLTKSDLRFIQREMREDDFLKHIGPNLPFSGRAARGLFAGLAESDRYGKGPEERRRKRG